MLNKCGKLTYEMACEAIHSDSHVTKSNDQYSQLLNDKSMENLS